MASPCGSHYPRQQGGGPCSLGDKCRAPRIDGKLLLCPKYKCAFCGELLHPAAAGCGVCYEDDKVMCPFGLGCATRKATAQSPRHHQPPQRTRPRASRAQQDVVSTDAPPPDEAAAASAKNGPKKRNVPAQGKKRGVKLGTKVVAQKTLEDWYNVCHQYRTSLANGKSLSQSAFLKSGASGDTFSGSVSEQQSFSRYLRLYDAGTLKPSEKKRCRDHKFKKVEQKLLEYLDLRKKAARSLLQKKSLQFAGAMGLDNFVASPGWLSATLKDYQDKIVRDEEEDEEEVPPKSPWDLISQEYRQWLSTVPCSKTEFNSASLVDRAQLRNLYDKRPPSKDA